MKTETQKGNNGSMSDVLAEVLRQHKERRRATRTVVTLPLRVRGVNTGGIKFEEVTRSINVSMTGALFLLRHSLNKGICLELSLPLPRSMQRTAAPKPVYETMAIVVRVEQGQDRETFKIAVRFRNTGVKHYYSET
jgi:hypothetical protein